MKEFSKFQIASFKRTAQNVYPLVRRKLKLLAERQDIDNELASLQLQIDAYQGPIKEVTGGFTTEDLIVREVVATGAVDKNGHPVKMTTYKLKYPETVVPVVNEPQAQEESIGQPSFSQELTADNVDVFAEEEEEVNINPENIEII